MHDFKIKTLKQESDSEIKGVSKPKPHSTKAHTSSIKSAGTYLFIIINVHLLNLHVCARAPKHLTSSIKLRLHIIINVHLFNLHACAGACVRDTHVISRGNARWMSGVRSSLPPTAKRQTEYRRLHIISAVVADAPLLPPTAKRRRIKLRR
uniref:Uncharacterized protein n=1 Tax=Ananas comosus var. bracteatus TaxID=296719 RepID=A0A6V7PQ48_ANACO|nr:unnamed protein product [Ananas comosus var. bracteatus]